jgi:hypothetical protein
MGYWVVEGSLDGEEWTEIDRRANHYPLLRGSPEASFPVSIPAECRFVRFAHIHSYYFESQGPVEISAVEFFGTLAEPESPLLPRLRMLGDSLEKAWGKLLHARLDFPLRNPNSKEGIIAYLTLRHDGNVHDKGIVTITSKSVNPHTSEFAVRNVADLASPGYLYSRNEPHQWVCWDFGEARIRPTHYTITCSKNALLKSWVVESSLGRGVWKVIDQRKRNKDLVKPPHTASFAVSDSAQCRFIRLTQTGKNHRGSRALSIVALEFFGAFVEGPD